MILVFDELIVKYGQKKMKHEDPMNKNIHLTDLCYSEIQIHNLSTQ